MDIVMVAPFAFSVKGTVRARMLPIAEELVDRGHDVHIVIPPWDNPDEGGRIRNKHGVILHHLEVKFEYGLQHIYLVWKAIKKVQSLSPEIVHVFKPIGESSAVALFLTLLTEYPVVLDTDDWEGDGGQNERRNRSWVEKRLIHYQEQITPQLVDAVTVASRTLETQIWGHDIPKGRTFYAPNGQSPNRIDIENTSADIVRRDLGIGDAPIVLLYTRFFEYRLERIVNLFSIVIDQYPQAEFIVIGKGKDNEHNEFRKMVEDSDISDSIHMLGWIEFEDLSDYFSATDVAVYPFEDTLINRSKCPAKLTELMVSKVPVVAEGVGQISEYIQHDQSGLLTPPGHQQAFANYVITLLRDEDKRKTLGATARERILSEFSWGSITDTVEDSYELVT